MAGAGRQAHREDYGGGGTVRQLSPLFDAPQYAEQFIELARKTLRCRDMQIRAKAVLVDTKGEPIISPKTKVQKVGWVDYRPQSEDLELTFAIFSRCASL